MTDTSSPTTRTLRLIWPQWQGAGRDNVAALLPEFPLTDARRGYAVGTRVLEAVLPPHEGPTAVVAVPDTESGAVDGIESTTEVTAALRDGLRCLEPLTTGAVDRVLTLGGECSVSVAPFSVLADRYGDDLAVVWVDAHPDVDTADTGYDGYHAMAVSMLTGHGDPRISGLLPATVPADRVALTGLCDWEEDAYAHVAEWGLPSFSPEQLRGSSAPLLEWLAGTGASKVAVHLDVDVVDSDEAVLGLGTVPGALTRAQVRRIISDLGNVADIVGLTVAEFIPRDVLALSPLIEGLPLTR
jgi:arginase